MEEINLKEFWDYYKRYLAFVIIMIVLAVGAMVSYDLFLKKPMYSTSTTILLVQADDNSGSSIEQNDIALNQKLVSTYSQIIKSRLVVSQVIDNLDLNYSYNELSGRISVKAVDDTEILKITVTDAEGEQAMRIANELSSVFSKEVREIYNIDNVSVIDVAILPTDPSNIHLVKDIIIAFAVGLVLSSGIVFVIFYFDDTLRDVDTLEKELELPVLAKVFKTKEECELIVDEKPNSPTAEGIRNLRTNLQFSSVDEDLKSVLITSSVPSDGKSYVSSNLAISFAQAGKKVLLIDCDLRKGRQHNLFNISGHKGLSNLLIGDISTYNDYIVKTDIKNLFLMSRGTVPPNPSELLNSKKNEKLMDILKNRFDIIILDGAPISGLSDSLILSKLVDETIIVSSINHTPKSELVNAKKALENVGAKLAGSVANQVVSKRGQYGGYYYYYGDRKEITSKEVREAEEHFDEVDEQVNIVRKISTPKKTKEKKEESK
ncbi:MAG: polysaccharide biosynthesis tyrosine autokinase [Bacilli bacterium]|nr:polysaccharide biosynthesis tyrosine autokinase [Bacilli bacterium]